MAPRNALTTRLRSVARGNVAYDPTQGDYLLGGSPEGSELTEALVRRGLAAAPPRDTGASRVPVVVTPQGNAALRAGEEIT